MSKFARFIHTHIRSLGLGPAVVILVLGWFIMCSPWFLGKRTVPWDSKDEFYPTLFYVSQTLRAGDLPFWNPYIYGGHPTISDPQSLLFSPLAVALMTAVDKPSAYWFDAIELLHLLLGGLGMLLVTVRFGRSPVAGLFSAAVYMFGGPAAARLQHVPLILAYGYFPFALLALEQAISSNRLRWGICFGVTAGIMGAHQVQDAYLFSLVLIGYIVHEAVSSSSITDFFVDHWRALLGGTCSWAITLAVPLYATLQFLPMSTRSSGFSFETAVAESMHPLTLVTFFVRNFFGNANLSRFWGLGDITQTFLYAGILPVVLFLFYGVATGAVFERQFRYFCGVGLCGLLYALGKFTPFYWLAYHTIPGVSLYKRPPDAAFVFNMVLAYATGFLMDELLVGPPRKFRRFLLFGTTAAVIGLFVWGIWFAAAAGKLRYLGKDLSLAVVFVGFALWLLQAMKAIRSATGRSLLFLGGVILLAIDLSVHNLGTAFNAHSREWASSLAGNFSEENPLVRRLKDGLNSDEIGPYRAEITSADSLWANGSMLAGIQSTQGYNPLRYLLYERVIGAQPIFSVPRPFTSMTPSYNSPMVNLLGVKYIVAVSALREIDPKVDETRFRLVFDHGIKVWQNPEVLPRVLTATSLYLEPKIDESIDSGRIAALDYQSVAVVPHLPHTLAALETRPESVTPLPGNGEARARVVRYRSSDVVISVQTERDTIVVLNDLYYPYWRVYVDDNEQELLQANYLFRGVHVKPGVHRVVFRFEPFSWPAMRTFMARLLAG